MKVLHVAASLGLRHGGVSVSVRELCRGLSQAGVKVEICTTLRGYDPSVDGPADDELKAAGVEPRYFSVHPWGWMGARYAYSPALGAFLRGMVPRFDLVHIHGVWQYPTLAAARACRHFRVPYVLSPCGALDPYGLRVRRGFKLLYGLLIERQTLRRAEAIHFTSPLEREQARMFGFNRPNVVIPRSLRLDGMPKPPLGAFRARHPEIGNRKILLFLGRLHPKKRLDLIVEAFTILARRHNDTHLVFAGPEDGGGSQAREKLKQSGLQRRATFTGLLKGADKWSALRDSSLFLLPSEDENFGVAVLEALATGLPVLISRYVGLADWIKRGQAGMVVDQNPSAWAAAIERILLDQPMTKSMGEAGIRLAAEEFSTPRVAASMRDFYERILQKS